MNEWVYTLVNDNIQRLALQSDETLHTLKHAGTLGCRDNAGTAWMGEVIRGDGPHGARRQRLLITCLTPAQTLAQSDSKPGQTRELHLHSYTMQLAVKGAMCQ